MKTRQGLKRGDLLQELDNTDQASSTEHWEKAPQNQSFRGQNGAVLGLESTQGRKLSRSDELISKQDSRAVLQHEDSISSTTGLEKPSGGNCTCEQRQPSLFLVQSPPQAGTSPFALDEDRSFTLWTTERRISLFLPSFQFLYHFLSPRSPTKSTHL